MISFRNASKEDLDILSRLYSPKTDEKVGQWKELQSKRLNDSLNNPDKEFIVILLDGNIVGHVFLNYSKPPYPQMSALVVREDLRSKGIGTEAIKEVERRVKGKGFNKVGLSVNPDNNPGARKLYERLGYMNTGKEKFLDYVDPYDGAEDWVIDLVKEI